MTATLVLKAGKDRPLLRRHPWVFAGAIERQQGRAEPGDTVRVVGADGRFLAWAAYSPASTIRARAWSFRERDAVDAALIERRIVQAITRRAELERDTDAVRLIFGEADGLPGLVADRYARQLVVQLLSAGAERWRDAIVAALGRAAGCDAIYERSEAAVREREGLAPREGPIDGAVPAPVEIVEHGLRYRVDVVRGHKTGFYIDQRDNRARVAAMAAGRRVLNCFAYTGGFTVAALAGGAVSAVSVDSSADALAAAREHVARNGLQAAAAEWVEADVFALLRQLHGAQRRFDLIVLDPPKFAPSPQHVERAARAYKEINLKALQLLAPGGLLFTFSCSGAIGIELFQKIVAGAVFDAGVDAQLLQRLQAGIDHPVAMTHPEGEYLKGLLLRV